MNRESIGALLLFVAVFALYAPSLRFELIHDDRQLILRQTVPESLADVASVFAEPHWPGLPYYRPVTRTTMVVQKYLHGEDPAPYHLFNVTLMGLTALVVFGLLRRPAFDVPTTPALLGAALFAMHPVASGAVYPACSGRETLVPAFLVLCSLYAFLTPGRLAYAASLLLATASLFAKELGAIVPALFVMADLLRVSPDPPGRDVARWARRYAPLVLVFAAYFVIRSELFGATLHRVAVFDRPSYPLWTLAYTLQTSFAPFVDLVYEPRLPVWQSLPRAIVWVPATALLAFAVWRRKDVSRPAVLFLVAWWGITQAPTANLLVQESPFAERYGFLSLFGLVGVLALLARDVWDDPRARTAVKTVSAVALVACAAITLLRGPHFANEMAFAEVWVKNDPASYKAHLNLGQSYVEMERWEDAVTHLGAASELRPRSGIIHNGLGYALWRNGDPAGAERHFGLAIRLAPKLAVARTNLGDLLQGRGRLDEAIRHYEQALRIAPGDPRARGQLAKARARQAGGQPHSPR